MATPHFSYTHRKDDLTEKNRQIEFLRNEKNSLVQENLDLELKLKTKEHDLKDASIKYTKLSLQNTKLVDDLKTSHDDYDSLLRSAKLKKPEEPLDDDKTIGSYFRVLHLGIEQWATKWAVNDVRSVQNREPHIKNIIMDKLQHVMRIEPTGIPPHLAANSFIIQRIPAMCLAALLWLFISERILDRPFAYLQATTDNPPTDSSRLPPKHENVSDALYTALIKCDADKAHAWRREALEILDPSTVVEKDPRTKIQSKARAEQQRKAFAQECAVDFFDPTESIPAWCRTTHTEADNRLNELTVVIAQALDFSARIWKQPAYLRCVHGIELQSTSFKVDSKYMVAHPIHQLGALGPLGSLSLDEPIDRLDDYPILMVVSPAIVAYGDDEGENYNHDQEPTRV